MFRAWYRAVIWYIPFFSDTDTNVAVEFAWTRLLLTYDMAASAQVSEGTDADPSVGGGADAKKNPIKKKITAMMILVTAIIPLLPNTGDGGGLSFVLMSICSSPLKKMVSP
jgi:hypothetical protein